MKKPLRAGRPKAASHYEVPYCCLREDSPSQRLELTYGGRDRTQPGTPANALPNAKPFHETPGYHGTLFIDPSSGAILSITLEVELKEGAPLIRAAIMVQYGAVTIGDRRYICPVRSQAFSMEQPVINPNGKPSGPPNLLVNETTFTHYHRLGTSTRMIALQHPVPSLNAIIQESQATGSIKWLRWELVNGK